MQYVGINVNSNEIQLFFFFFSRLNTFMGLVNFLMYLYTFMKKYKPVPHHVVLYCFSLEQLSAVVPHY